MRAAQNEDLTILGCPRCRLKGEYMAGRNIEDKIRCSFCGKSQEQVRKMIAGPNGAFICDECVEAVSYTHLTLPTIA